MDGNSGKGADWKHPYAPLTPRNRDRPNDCSNAFTQMFFLVEPLRKYYIENTDKGAFHSSLGVLFEEMCTIGQSQESFTNANGILVTLDPNSGSYIPQVEELIQEADDYGNTPFVDAFKWLQSRITDTLNEVNRIRKVSPQPVNNAQEAWKYYQNNVDNTIIADLLAIQWTENFSGSECGHQNDRWLHENHLGFSISSGPTDERQRVPTVGDYLYEFLSVQTIVDKCPQCNCKQTGILSRSVTRFPPFFLVNIRRFDKKGNKDCSPLGIDLQLKLSNERQYRLNNAILHKGTATNGFYSTLAREAPNQWAVLMDQTVVKPVPDALAETMLAQFGYILMYQQMTQEEILKAQLEAACLLAKNGSVKADEDMFHVTDLEGPAHQVGKHPYCGLTNLHLICYSNSVLQSLFTCTRIRQYLLEQRHSAEPFHRLLAELFTAMESESRAKFKFGQPVVNSEKMFNQHFRKKRSEFKTNAMHDAQEFLAVLVELVHQEANSTLAKRDQKPKENPEFSNAVDQWTYYCTNVEFSQLANLLMGQVESTLTCLVCSHQSRSWTVIWQLQVDLAQGSTDQPLTLAKCINEFSKSEILQDDSAPTCLKCQKRQTSRKQQSICRLPPYLVVHMKRFKASGQKIDREVAIESSLRLCGQTLELSSVVCHRGSESVGHYYTMVREDTDKWIQLDDEAIRGPFTTQKANEKLNALAYLCIYQVTTKQESPIPKNTMAADRATNNK